MKNINALSILLIASLITLSLAGCARSNSTSEEKKGTSEAKTTNEVKKAADFELKDLQGTTHKLSDYAGKKVYIKYWASWCSICLAGLDEINTLAAEDKDFEIITIVAPSFRGEKNSEDFKKWFSGLEYKNLTVLLDEDGMVSKKYEVRGYPTSIFVGNDGSLVKTLLGHYGNEQLRNEFKEIK